MDVVGVYVTPKTVSNSLMPAEAYKDFKLVLIAESVEPNEEFVRKYVVGESQSTAAFLTPDNDVHVDRDM